MQYDMEKYYEKTSESLDTWLFQSQAEAKHWRIAFAICLSALLVSLWYAYQVARQPKAIPYIVEIDSKGNVQSNRKLETIKYDLSAEIIKDKLRQVVQQFRNIPADKVVLKANLEEAQKYFSANGKRALEALLRKDNLMEQDEQRRSIEIQNINRLSLQSWQVEWQERNFYPTGQLASKNLYSAVFNVITQAPRTEKDLLNNPLGIWIHEFDIARQYDIKTEGEKGKP